MFQIKTNLFVKHPELQQQRACQYALLQTEVVFVCLFAFLFHFKGGSDVINVSEEHDFKTILCPYCCQISIIWQTGTEFPP